jgi:type I restriction enzyme S subunit
VSELPASWVETTLGDLTVDSAQRIPAADEQFQYVDIASIDRATKQITSPQLLWGRDAPSRARKEIRAGDVLVSMTRPNLNAVALVPPQLDWQIASTGFDVLRSTGVEPRWLFYVVRTQLFIDRMSKLVQGALYPAVSSKDVRSYVAPLAPLSEQRIADKLDVVLARVDACRERLGRVPAILKRFRQAILAAATSGKLTEEWRETQGNNGWLELTLKQVAVVIDPNPSHRYPSYESGTVPIIATEQFEGRDGYDTSKSKLVNASFYEERLAVHGFVPHDIVFARKGRLGLARRLPELEKFVFSHTIFIVRANEPAHAAYLLWYLRNDECVAWLLHEMNSNQGVPTLGKSFMERLPVRLPPIEEQQEIVRRVETLFAYADRLEARYTAARAQVARLTPALLAKAFRGELVPQDPNDEPASALLERIRAARAAQPTAKRGRKLPAIRVPRAPKEKAAMTKSRHDDDVQHKPYLAGLLREAGGIASVEDLFRHAKLPVTDFYKQLAWEVENGHIRDDETRLEAA